MKNVSKLTAEQWHKYWKNTGIGFYILVTTMVINAFIKELCNVKWANPVMEMTMLLLAPLLYIAIANSSIKPSHSLRFNIAVSTLISSIILVVFLIGNKYNAFRIIENNMISDSIWGIVILLAWDMYFIICILKTLLMDKKH